MNRFERGAWLRARLFISDVLTVAAMFIPPFRAACKRWRALRTVSKSIAEDYP